MVFPPSSTWYFVLSHFFLSDLEFAPLTLSVCLLRQSATFFSDDKQYLPFLLLFEYLC